MKIALYDFDGTLFRGDSFIDFAIFARGKMALLTTMMRAFPKLAMWKLHLLSNSEAKQSLFSKLYKGLPASELTHSGEKFADVIDSKLIEDTFAQMEQQKREGWRVIVVSASLDIWLRHWCDKHGVELICTQAETDSRHQFTGKFATPNCHGKEKLRRVLQYLDIETADEAKSRHSFLAYGDEDADDYIKSLCEQN